MAVRSIDENTCRACGSRRGVELIRLRDGAYRQCASCELIAASPMPEDLERLNQEAFSESLESYVAKVGTRRRHNRNKLKRFTRYRQTGNLLEIGCSAGAALAVARWLGWNVKGVEPCVATSAFARRELGLDVFTGTVEAAAYPDDYFDVVFTNAVLEHLRDPLSVMCECRRVLRPGGVFYAETVNWDSYTRRLLGNHWKYLYPKGHVHLYTPRNVISLCERAGLEHVRTWTTGVRMRARAPANFTCAWYWHLLKGPLSLLARRTGKGDHLQFLARKSLG